ncbi:MAG: winged helix-turn-helix transcriptional regulator [Alphaproteobacteria bacterium]|nr:winged helix-turn-helix transcriptional regulator [Alphaproteobacteria bacterium]
MNKLGIATLDEQESGPLGLSSEAEITLGLLNAVHDNSEHTQRSISKDLGIALGMANAYLKRCAKKGLIKIAQMPPNRYAYYLTPQGFAEKSRLTAEYLSQSFNLFRVARRQYEDLFQLCAENGWQRVALAGVGDIGEIALLSRGGHSITVLGFVDAKAAADSYLDLKVARQPLEFEPLDALLLTDMKDPQGTFDALQAIFDPKRVLFPAFMNVSRRPPPIVGEELAS